MSSQFDRIRLDITQRYIELAESGFVDSKDLDLARSVVDVLKDVTKSGSTQSVTGKHTYAQPMNDKFSR